MGPAEMLRAEECEAVTFNLANLACSPKPNTLLSKAVSKLINSLVEAVSKQVVVASITLESDESYASARPCTSSTSAVNVEWMTSLSVAVCSIQLDSVLCVDEGLPVLNSECVKREHLL
jgi:hypothetical protein